MPSLNDLRSALALPAGEDAHFQTLEEAQSLLPDAPRSALKAAALRLLAQESLHSLPAAASLLTSLAQTLHSHRPERELVGWLASVTGGQAEVRSSWGDVVASAGAPSGPHLEQRLTYEGRPIGSLHLWAGAEWQPLFWWPQSLPNSPGCKRRRRVRQGGASASACSKRCCRAT